MQGKARDILILLRITDFSTTGSAGLKCRNNGRKNILGLCLYVITVFTVFRLLTDFVCLYNYEF